MPSSDESTNNSIPEIIINNTEDSSVAESSSPHIQASLNDPSSLHLPPEDTHHDIQTSPLTPSPHPPSFPPPLQTIPHKNHHQFRQSSSIDNKFGEESAALNYSDDFEYESDFDYESDFEELSGSRASTGKNTLSGSSASIGNYASIRTDEEHILESDHTTVYTTLLKRLKGTPPPLPAKKREINVDVDAQKYLLID
ncbi:hypothetical protein BC829DRAFT_421732 [Chytridium lagenaria]|nr:hypothetical protein BC829DRAFT_421732 [Chytridium lagenaria]